MSRGRRGRVGKTAHISISRGHAASPSRRRHPVPSSSQTHENWMEANRYNMDDLREHKKLALRQAA
ncbi:hypothetical protein GHK29_03155 [Sinorhizobium medicae]|nr:hypothetical protein [Sinorhizobium medicae]